MKKQKIYLVTLLIVMSLFTNVCVYAIPVVIPLDVEYVDPEDSQGNNGKSPVMIPEVSIDGHTLKYDSSCFGLQLQLINENGIAVYFTVIPTESNLLELPSYLSGNFVIQIISENYCFFGLINL